MRQFLLPDLGEGLEEAEIVAWHVTEGDHVVSDQPLVSVETDKAVVEVPSPRSGRIAHLFGAKGDLVKVGATLVEFAEGPEEDTGTVVGELEQGKRTQEKSAPRPGEPTQARPVQILPAVRALARKKKTYNFPWQTTLLIKSARWLPEWLLKRVFEGKTGGSKCPE